MIFLVTKKQIESHLGKVIKYWNEYTKIIFFDTSEKLEEDLIKYRPVIGDICRGIWAGDILICYAVLSVTNRTWLRFCVGPLTEQEHICRLTQKFVISDFARFNVKPPDYTLRSGNNVLRRFEEQLRLIT